MPAAVRLRLALSHLVGWLADRRVPRPLRRPLYGLYARATGADLAEARLSPADFPSLSAFFVRHLREGARLVDPRPDRLISPCDGTLQALDRVTEGSILQAKGRPYAAAELLAGAADRLELDGAWAWTIYLGPRDYHRVHAPLGGTLTEVRWVPGDRRSVAPRVVAARPVFATNERAVLRLETHGRPWFLVMVGALNVGRIRVVGVEPRADTRAARDFAKGEELARFELGSTVVLILPAGAATPEEGLEPGLSLRLGEPIGVLGPSS